MAPISFEEGGCLGWLRLLGILPSLLLPRRLIRLLGRDERCPPRPRQAKTPPGSGTLGRGTLAVLRRAKQQQDCAVRPRSPQQQPAAERASELASSGRTPWLFQARSRTAAGGRQAPLRRLPPPPHLLLRAGRAQPLLTCPAVSWQGHHELLEIQSTAIARKAATNHTQAGRGKLGRP